MISYAKNVSKFLYFCFYLSLTFFFSSNTLADDLRIGVLQYGTVHWELDVIKHHNLLKDKNINLKPIKAASPNALNVMLQSGHVDLVVGDWIWVSRQRNQGRNFTSFPYSLADGSLMVHSDSNVNHLDQLYGKKIGIAGGEVNKNWLIIRAYSLNKYGKDIKDHIKPVFAAPPLLNQLMLRGDFDAVLNFWHYNAKLETKGMRPLLSIDQMLDDLSINHSIPLLVWIFKEDWAVNNSDVLNTFLDTSFSAKKILINSDEEWERIRPLTRIEDDKELYAMRNYYRSGVPSKFDDQHIQSASLLFSLFSKLAGADLIGDDPVFNKGTFYTGYEINM